MSPGKTHRCSFWDGSKQCRKQGAGNPPLCPGHAQDGDFDDVDVIVEAAVTRLVEIPQVQGILDSVGGLLDRFSGVLDRAPGAPRRQGEAPPDWRERARRMAAEAARRATERAERAPRPAAAPAKEDPRVIMGFPPGQPLTKDVIKKRHRELAGIYHPDKGGSTLTMQKVTAARDELLASIGAR